MCHLVLNSEFNQGLIAFKTTLNHPGRLDHKQYLCTMMHNGTVTLKINKGHNIFFYRKCILAIFQEKIF